MKRMFWVKLTFILVGLIFVYGYDQQNVTADEACDTSTTCGRSSSGNECYCTLSSNGSCNGCFIPSGQTGCGSCHKAGDLELD